MGIDRRKFIKASTLVGGVLSSLPFANDLDLKAKKSLKVAFLSDVHIKDNDVAKLGMRQAFRHINNHKSQPEFIINGGDSIMDALAIDKAGTEAQWALWNQILQEENKLPIYHCIGNHDVWGWQVKDPNIKSDPLYDKNWAVLQHKMPNRYYSFAKDKWHFIVLDSTQENNGGYIAKLDEEQYVWLENELKSINPSKHICVVSHIPIISFCSAMFFDDMLPNGDWKLSRALLHTDARRIKSLFKKYKNIKVCLSGHIHLQDEVSYLGIQYFCNGAVSGAWWKGDFHDFGPAYALFDFYDDGTISREMIQYNG